jgi:hypothetical protein
VARTFRGHGRPVATVAVGVAAPTSRPHTAAHGHPARALLAIRAHRRRGVGDECACLQRRPERLQHLGHLSVDEPRHPLSSPARTPGRNTNRARQGPATPPRASIAAPARPTGSCCDHRENSRTPLTGKIPATGAVSGRRESEVSGKPRPVIRHGDGALYGDVATGRHARVDARPGLPRQRLPTPGPRQKQGAGPTGIHGAGEEPASRPCVRFRPDASAPSAGPARACSGRAAGVRRRDDPTALPTTRVIARIAARAT